MSILNTAVVGLGVGEQHALTYLDDSRTNLKYVVDYDDRRLADFNQKHNTGFERITFDKVLSDSDIHLVSLASYDNCHYRQVVDCLDSNKHVFVEKPLCQSANEMNDIYNAFNRGNNALMSNLILRKSPLFNCVMEMIRNNDFGEIYAFDADYLYGRMHKITHGWRKDVVDYSVMEGGGIHLIDLMLRLVGELPISVRTLGNKIVTKESKFKYQDYQCSTFNFETGLLGRVTANFGCVHKHQHVMRIFGTKATFIYDDMGARIHWSRDNEVQKVDYLSLEAKPISKGALISSFLSKIDHSNFNDVAQLEFDLMSVVIASDRSLLTNKVEKIDYLDM